MLEYLFIISSVIYDIAYDIQYMIYCISDPIYPCSKVTKIFASGLVTSHKEISVRNIARRIFIMTMFDPNFPIKIPYFSSQAIILIPISRTDINFNRIDATIFEKFRIIIQRATFSSHIFILNPGCSLPR